MEIGKTTIKTEVHRVEKVISKYLPLQITYSLRRGNSHCTED